MTPARSTLQPSIAVVGGGINGLSCAWQLALRGAKVTLFEQGKLFTAQRNHATSILHGGMDHLTNGELRLAYEALQERQWLQQQCPELCSRATITVPLYPDSPRPRWQVNTGLYLYENLTGRRVLPKHHWLTRDQLIASSGELQTEHLVGAYRYSEVCIDQGQLLRWVAQQARAAGVQIAENSPIRHIGSEGSVRLDSYRHQFDFIINATGAASLKLLQQSGLTTKSRLKLVRESHLVLSGKSDGHYHLPIARTSNSLYVLPWHGDTLLGASAIIQAADEATDVTEQEIDYLLQQYNKHFRQQRSHADIIKVRSSLRHHVKSSIAVTHLSNEYLFERQRQLLTVFGGHWTTARALGQKVAAQLFD